ncbi:hypothetical protein [Paenibacillus sp. GCM10012303]|uniref:hypothetical protein n=1 Tax=Paenibacillus sp. GCM10012303 TaxID=3317340 RepID=UPI00361552E3
MRPVPFPYTPAPAYTLYVRPVVVYRDIYHPYVIRILHPVPCMPLPAGTGCCHVSGRGRT